jgi:NAD(P)-dependent dehydrogenase (short-subunit alcohol dehydrogenase family)
MFKEKEMDDKLKGSRCLVVGATGNIGRGAAKAFLNHGAGTVVIVGRSREKLAGITNGYLGGDKRILQIVADVSTPEGAEKAAREVSSEVGEIDHLVSSSGPWWDAGPIYRLETRVWRAAFQANVDTHFFCFREFSRIMNNGGSYVIMNGAAADFLPKSGLTGICSFSVRGLCKVILAEGVELGFRIHELLLRLRVADGPPNPGMKSELFGELFAAIASNSLGIEPGSTIDIYSEDIFKSLVAKLR